jgi:glyoxylase-like metal-dependent hydrolase (beta-lactamase superfamily II)
MNKPDNTLYPKIVLSRVGYSNSALVVNGKNSVLIDTGVAGHLQQFITLFAQHNLTPADIQLIILTHTHYDHTGNLHELVKVTGAKVIVHKNEFENLKVGFTPIPKGVVLKTRIVSKLGKWFAPKYASPKPFTADLINTGEFDLTRFGIDGKIIVTPGHTNGSQSVLIGKKLISGDTFLNLKSGTVFPIFANQPKVLLKTWQTIFDLGVEEIYPGHGRKMKVEDAFPEFKRWKKKLDS